MKPEQEVPDEGTGAEGKRKVLNSFFLPAPSALLRVPSPFMGRLHADGTRASDRYVVFEGSLHTLRDWDPYTVTHLEAYGREHPGTGWDPHESDILPAGWKYYTKEVRPEDLTEGQVRVTTHGMWRGWRMYMAAFDADGNVMLRGQVGKDLYHRALNGQEPGVISVDGTDAYWHIDLTVVREDVTDITYEYMNLRPVRRPVYIGDLKNH